MSPINDRINAALAGRYRVEREVGAGGMATVYLARDERHHRNVALKVLRPELAAVLGTDRFLSEIRVTANLQHPHLLPLFDSGEADGQLFYVMPFVEGESLRAYLERERQLPVEEAVRIAVAVAGALDYAHRRGVVHRDLKPENILLHDGQPLVADFGIALAVSNAGGARVTQTGISLGTPSYMSPEQATGDRHIDARSDIYSLAAVLYEMLVGDPPHVASTSQAVIAKVLTERAQSIRTQRESVPAHVDGAIAKALEKLPADRFSSAADFAAALTNPLSLPVATPITELAATERRWRSLSAALGASLMIVLVAWGWDTLVRAPDAPAAESATRVSILPAEGGFDELGPFPVISPDGRIVAFSATAQSGSGQQLWARSLDTTEPRPVPGTEGGHYPFWSPDGRSLGFFAAGKLKRVEIASGVPQTLADAPNPRGGTWSRDDVIVFWPSPSGLHRVSAAGGTVVRLKAPEEQRDWYPSFLPDGHHLLVTRRSVTEPGIYLVDLDDLNGRLLLAERSRAQYANGYLFFSRRGELFAQQFDLDDLALTGDATRLVEQVGWWDWGGATFSVAGTNLVSWARSWSPPAQLVTYDRAGRRIGTVGQVGLHIGLDVSPAEDQVAVEMIDPATSAFDTWLIDLSNGITTRFAYDPVGGLAGSPRWMPNGRAILYTRFDNDFYIKPIRGTEESAGRYDGGFFLDVSPDDRQALYVNNRGSSADILVLDLATGETQPFLATAFNENGGKLSPDGEWVAYMSDESGESEIYVDAFPTKGNKIRVSPEGGRSPQWRADGGELYYISASEMLMASTITVTPTGLSFSTRPLFRAPRGAGAGARDLYAPLANGARFLFREIVESPAQPALDVILNWPALVSNR